jgi:hypothetical protein
MSRECLEGQPLVLPAIIRLTFEILLPMFAKLLLLVYLKTRLISR